MPVIGRAFVAWKNWTRWLQGRWGPTVGIPTDSKSTGGPTTPIAEDFDSQTETINPPLSHPGWLRDPFGLSSLRFWDGAAWTAWESNTPYDVRVGQVPEAVIAVVLSEYDERQAADPSLIDADDTVESKLATLLTARRRMRSGQLAAADYERIRQQIVLDLAGSAQQPQD